MNKERRKIVLEAKSQILDAIRLEMDSSIYEVIIEEVVEKALSLYDVVGRSEQLPNMTLEQAIAKAKPNMDKINDVDKHLDDIR